MHRLPVLLAIFLAVVPLYGCATAPEPSSEDRSAPPAVSVSGSPAPAVPGAAQSPTGPAAAQSPAGPAAPRRPFDPNKGLETTHLTEKAWIQAVRTKLAERLKVDPESLRFSAARQWAAFVRGPDESQARPGRRPPPRRFEIFVVDMEGRPQGRFRPITARGSDEPPKDLRFLGEDRLVYEVVEPPPPPPPPVKPARVARRGRPARANKPAKPKRAPAPAVPEVPDPWAGLPRRQFVIQPFTQPPVRPGYEPPARPRKLRPVRLEGVHFDFANKFERLAHVGGKPQAAFVSVDGQQVYPRKGRTVIASELAWSKDGRSLAFLETRTGAAARLVLLAEYDNPSGDTLWDLPPGARLEGARVFWAGSGKLVVGKTVMRPLFATSFHKESPREFSP